LAVCAGEDEAYENEDDYSVLEDRADEYLDKYDEVYGKEADEVLGTVGVSEIHGGDLEAEVDRVVGTVGESELCEALGFETKDLEAEADRVAGNVISDDEQFDRQMDRHYGVDRDPVTLDTEWTTGSRTSTVDADRPIASDIRSHVEIDSGSMAFATSTESAADAHATGVSNATELHKSLFGDTESVIQDKLLDAAVDVARRVGGDRKAFVDVLDAIVNPDAPPNAGASHPEVSKSVDGYFEQMLLRVLEGRDDQHIRELVSQLGGNTSGDLRTSLQDAVDGPLAVLRASSVTPTVVVSLPNNLFDSDFKTKTRQNLIEYVCALGHGCDLKVVASPMVQQRFIWETDRDLIPEGVAENTLARHTNRLDTSQLTEAVSEARSNIKPADPEWDILFLISEGRTDQARYGSGSDLLADQRVDYDRSTVSTFVSTLERNGLVDVHGPQNARYAVVTEAGLAALDTMRPIIGKQSDLQAFESVENPEGVGDTLVSDVDLCSPQQGREGGTALAQSAQQDNPAGGSASSSASSDSEPDGEGFRHYSTGHAGVVPMTQWEHHGVVGSCAGTTVAMDNVAVSGVDKDSRFDQWTVERLDDKRSPLYSYREDLDELVVGAEFHDPLQFTVSLARGMLSDLAFDQVLTVDRLDGAAGDLDALIGGDKHTLRDKRCLGWLKNAYDGEGYQQALKDAIEELCELTHRLKHNDFETEGDKYDFRGEIIKNAQGLIGTATGIYDLLDVDLYRTVRIPGDVKRNMSSDHTETQYLKHTLVRAMTISSKMGAYTQSRVHFEPDEDKRQAMGAGPEIDAEDPTGTHIGSWSIVGHDVDTLADDIRDALEDPGQFGLEYQDDGENFTGFLVDIPITTGISREKITRTLKRGLQDRNMQVTSHSVSVMQAFCGSTHDVAKAIYRLGSEKQRRKVRVDDLKQALKHIPRTQILPSAPTPQSKILHALIRSSKPLSQPELCDRADIAPSTFAGWGTNTSHRDQLEAFGLIRETDEGWAICLRYKEGDLAADADALPWYAVMDDDSSPRDQSVDAGELQEESLQGALYDAMLVLEDAEHFGDPDHPVTGAIHGSLTGDDLETLVACRPEWEGLVYAIVAFRQNDPFSIGDDPQTDERVEIRSQTTTATTGKPPDQEPIASFEAEHAAVADD
jgi:DNA-binding MarR family transcriptional regulator